MICEYDLLRLACAMLAKRGADGQRCGRRKTSTCEAQRWVLQHCHRALPLLSLEYSSIGPSSPRDDGGAKIGSLNAALKAWHLVRAPHSRTNTHTRLMHCTCAPRTAFIYLFYDYLLLCQANASADGQSRLHSSTHARSKTRRHLARRTAALEYTLSRQPPCQAQCSTARPAQPVFRGKSHLVSLE